MNARFKKVLQFLKHTLYRVGQLFLVLLLILFIDMTYRYLKEPVIEHDDNDLQYVLQWLGPPANASQLLNSFHPQGNWSGDIQKMFALKLDDKVVAEVIQRTHFVRGDKITTELRQDVKFVQTFTVDAPWFPKQEELLTSEYFLFPIGHGNYVSSATRLVIIHPEENILYFVIAKM